MAATYYVWQTGDNSTGADWAHAYTSVAALLAGQALADGDLVKVDKTYPGPAAGAITWTFPEAGAGTVRVVCVDKTAADAAATGAAEGTGGNTALGINTANLSTAAAYIAGFAFSAGAGGASSTAKINLTGAVSNTAGKITFESCSYFCNSTASGTCVSVGSSTAGSSSDSVTIFRNCVFKFGATTQSIVLNGGRIEFHNCSVDASGSKPATLFTTVTGSRFDLFCTSCDWTWCTNLISAANVGKQQARFVNCATVAAANLVTGTNQGFTSFAADFIACAPVDGTNGPDILQYFHSDYYGTIAGDQTVYLTTSPATGTQDDGTATAYSHKMTPSAIVSAAHPQYSPWYTVKATATGSKTVSLKAADTEAAPLKDSELWLEVVYMGGANVANSPMSQLEATAPLISGTLSRDVLAAGSNLTDTNAAWTGVTETDTYTLAKTVTIDYQGYLMVRAALGKQTTNPVYIDPNPTIA